MSVLTSVIVLLLMLFSMHLSHNTVILSSAETVICLFGPLAPNTVSYPLVDRLCTE